MSEWNAEQYLKFMHERSQPVYDLMDLISHRSSMRIIDLGCGPGDHTKTLHERFRAIQTIGVDSSQEMLRKAPRAQGLSFHLGDITDFSGESEFDLIFSNAALHWVGGHEELIARFHRALRPGGQLAVQLPKNGAHPSQAIAYQLEREEPFSGYPRCPLEKNTLEPEAYATLLHRLGFRSIKVRLHVYLHLLPSAEEVVEWMKGSMLTHYRSTMPAGVYHSFEIEYRRRVVEALGPEQPYLYTFKRILMHAVK